MHPKKIEFIQQVECGNTPSEELLQAIAAMLKSEKGGARRKDSRNDAIRAVTAMLYHDGLPLVHAMEKGFTHFDGPKDERERRRIIKARPCHLVMRYREGDSVEIYWTNDIENRTVHCAFGRNSDGGLELKCVIPRCYVTKVMYPGE